MRYLFLVLAAPLFAQILTLEQAREMALANHPLLASLIFRPERLLNRPSRFYRYSHLNLALV